MTQPPFPLVCSGRRPSAGPGRQHRRILYLARPIASVLVLGLVTTLMVGPALIGVLSFVFAARLDGPHLDSIVPSFAMPIFESGRALVTLVLATKVMRASELA